MINALAIALLSIAILFVGSCVVKSIARGTVVLHGALLTASDFERRVSRLEISAELAEAQRGTAKAYRDLTATLEARTAEVNSMRPTMVQSQSKSTH